MLDFISGMITMGFLLAGLFFLRFWTRTRDLLFAAFAAAFSLLAVNQGIIALAGIPREEQSWVYLLRLAAFALIVGAIVYKNLKARSRPRPLPGGDKPGSRGCQR